MDDQEFTGSADEFLSMGETAPETPTDDAAPDTQDTESPTAADQDVAEEDDDLSPADRVAAVFGEAPDAEEAAEPVEQELDGEDDDPPGDLSTLSPEKLMALAEEALRLRAEVATTSASNDQAALNQEIESLDAQAVGRVQQRYDREVVATSNSHYGGLLTQAEVALFIAAQDDNTPEQYFAQRINGVRQPILNAQRAWEAKQAAAWEAEITREVETSRKQHPGLRRKYAEHLAEKHNLPPRAVDEILKITNTDDMPVFAQSLDESVKAHAKEKRQNTQALRSQAAKTTQANTITSPATGKPRSTKSTQLKGDEAEFFEMNRRAKSVFSRT